MAGRISISILSVLPRISLCTTNHTQPVRMLACEYAVRECAVLGDARFVRLCVVCGTSRNGIRRHFLMDLKGTRSDRGRSRRRHHYHH